MKTLIIILSLLSVALAGHIFVEQPQVKWQNTGYFSEIILRFSLENMITSTDYIKITLPADFDGYSVATLFQGATSIGATVSGSAGYYFVKPAANLAANTWYKVSLTLGAKAISQAAGLVAAPIQMQTVSSTVTSGTDMAIVYDENLSCGQFAIDVAPGTSLTTQASCLQTQVQAPKDYTSGTPAVNTYKVLSTSYTVYFDIKTQNDYLNGAFIKIQMSDTNFKFTGSCSSDANTCVGVGQTGYQSTCVNTTLDSGACTVSSATGEVGKYITLEHQSSILKTQWKRVKATVTNPSVYQAALGSVQVYLYSRQADTFKYYEVKTSGFGDLFGTNMITITDSGVLYFWGLREQSIATTSAGWGCPIGLYATAKTAGTPVLAAVSTASVLVIWNKVQVNFVVGSAFPTLPTALFYQVVVATGNSNGIAVPSINTNLPMVSGLACSVSGTAPALKITCTKVGQVSAAAYWFAFATKLDQEVVGAAGSYLVHFEISTGTIFTTGSTGVTPNVIINDEFMSGSSALAAITGTIGLGNQVVDLDTSAITTDAQYTTAAPKLFTLAAGNQNRCAMQMPPTAGVSLLFLVAPYPSQLCCVDGATVATTKSANCWNAAGNTRTATTGICGDITTATNMGDRVLMRLIANPNVINFASTSTFANQGIARYYSGFLVGSKSTAVSAAAGNMIGQYLTSANAKNITQQQTANWYNIWQTEAGTTVNGVTSQSYAHLAWSCIDAATSTAESYNCVASQPTTATLVPSFYMPSTVMNTNFKGNPLYPNQYVADFILCFRFLSATATIAAGDAALTTIPFVIKGATGTVAEGKLASAGVLQTQVFNGGLDLTTSFRVNIVNFGKLTTAYNIGAIVPALLRVGGFIATADHTSNAGIAMFLDEGFLATTDYETSSQNACWSALDATVTCSTILSTATPTTQKFYYSPVMTRVAINSAVTAATEFNFYVLVKANENVKAMNMGLVNKDATGNSYDMVKHFTLYGFAFGVTQTAIYNYFTTQTIGAQADQASAGLAFTVPLTAVNGVAGEKLTTCAITAQLATITNIYAGLSAANVTVNAATAATCTTLLSNHYITPTSTSDSTRAFTGKWGSHFEVYSLGIKYWANGAVTWGLSVTTQPVMNKCVQLSWKQVSTTDLRTHYAITCPADVGSIATAPTLITGSSQTLSFATWDFPWYLGVAAAPFVDLGYIWTTVNGQAQLIIAQNSAVVVQGAASAGTKCTLNAISMAGMSGQGQKIQVKLTTPLNIVLTNGVAALNLNKFLIVLTPTSIGTTAMNPLICYTQVDADCATTGITAFTLTKTFASTAATGATISITGEIQLNFWVGSTDTAAIAGTYSGKIQAYQYQLTALTGPASADVNSCDATTAVTWTSPASAYNAAVQNVAVTWNTMSAVQGQFSVSWGINVAFLDFSYFEINLDFLNTANTNVIGKNTKCNMMSGSSFDYTFNTLSDGTSFAAVLAKPKTQLAAAGRQLTSQSFQLLCKGVLGPTTTLVASNHVTVKYLVDSSHVIHQAFDTGFSATAPTTNAADRTVLDAPSVPAALASTSTIQYSIDNAGLSKTWMDQGMEAVYTFNLKVTKANPSVAAGVWIIVEFTRAIAPKLNHKGKLYCETGFNTTISQTYCEFVNDRRVRILSNIAMQNTTVATTGYLFSIYGVAQPGAWLASYNTIYFAIQQSTSGSIVYQTTILDKDIGVAVPNVLDSQAYSVSTNWTKTTGSFNIDLKLGVGQVVNNQDFYVLFPGEFDDGFFNGFAPSCSLTRRLPDWSGFDSTSFIANCTYVKARRVRLFFSVDSANAGAAWWYRLTISGVPTPVMPSGGFSFPIVMIPSAVAGTTIKYRTVSGSMNTTYQGFGDQALTQIQWQNSPVFAKIGVYSGAAALLPVTGTRFLEAITLTTTATSNFVFLPTTFVISSGMSSLPFIFAPKSTTSPGLAFMQFTTTTTGYAPIPPLKVAVVPDQCVVQNVNNYKFPFGTGAQSLPYVIDFSSCQPESQIKLKIFAMNSSATGVANIGQNFDSTNFTVDGSGTSKEYTVQAGGVPQVSFVVASTSQTVSAKAGVGKLLFQFIASTNQASYGISNVIATVDSVLPDLIGATLTWSVTPPSATAQATAAFTFATISYTCDKPAVFYYAVSTDNTTLSALTFTTIKANSFDVATMQSWPTGSSHNIYGYNIDRVGGSPQSVIIQRVKAGTQYFGFGVCVTAAGASAINTTSSKYVTWNQTDNGGKPVVAGLTYSSPLTTAQIASSCSAYSNAIGIPCNSTVCPNQLLACPATTSTTTTPAATTNTTATNTTTNTTARRRRQLQTVYNCSQIANCTTCASNTTCAACAAGLYVNTDLKSCVTACPANNQITSGVCTVISTVTTYYYTANPDIFAGQDKTSTVVSQGLASPVFSTLFLKNANLGSVTYQSYQVLSYTGTPAVGTPSIVASYSGMTDTTVFFQATLNGTDGFVFYGIATGTPATPTLAQLKTQTLVNGTLAQGFAVYVQNGGSFNQTIRNLQTGTSYTGYYAGQNIYPDLTVGGATAVSSQQFQTTGTSNVTTTFASSISTGFFALLALLFALFILV